MVKENRKRKKKKRKKIDNDEDDNDDNYVDDDDVIFSFQLSLSLFLLTKTRPDTRPADAAIVFFNTCILPKTKRRLVEGLDVQVDRQMYGRTEIRKYGLDEQIGERRDG